MKAHAPWLLALALAACSRPDLIPSAPAPTAAPTPPAATPTAAATVIATAAPRAPAPCAPIGGRPELVAEAPGATTFTTDGTDLFWSDGHAIFKRAVSGGEPTRIVNDAVSVAEVKQLEVDGDQLWLAAAKWSGSSCLGLVGFVGRDGGPVQKVGPAGCADAFALSEDKVAFTHQSTAPGGSIAGNVFAAPRTKGGKTTVLERGINGSGSVATDGTYAYFPGDIGAIHRILLTDGPTEVVSKERAGIESISGTRFAVDDTDLYVYFGHLNLRGLGIMKLPKAGGPGTLLVEALPMTPRGEDYPKAPLRLTDTHVLWSHPGTGVVKRIAKKERCGAETIAADQPGADWIAITPSHFYWLNEMSATPQVMRIAR